MWSLGRMKQFSFLIGSRTSQQTQRSEIVCYLPPVMYGVFDSSGNHSLNGQQFQTHWTDTITTKIWPLGQNSFWYCPKFVCHFLFHFLRIDILELTVTKHLWTYLHLNVRNNCSLISVLVELLYSLRQGFLALYCAMEPSESLVKLTDPFSQKCI